MAETLAERLLRSFERHGHRVAARLASEDITYGELGARAGRVAQVLAEHQVGRGQRVGVWMEKSFDSLAVLLGSVLAGAAYVPLDVRAPQRRVLAMAADADLAALAVDALRRPLLPEMKGALPSLRLTLEEGAVRDGPTRGGSPVQLPAPSEEEPAYILYTSGSTGRPKGVVLSHRAALGFVDWCLRTLHPGPEDRMVSHAPWHFDLSTFDLFVTLSAGGSVRLLNGVEAMLGPWLARNVSSWGITHWYSVPAALISMVQGGLASAGWPEARVVLFAGEPFPTPKLVELQRAVPRAQLYNLFGPTETNVCTYYRVPELRDGETRPLPIGRPCEHLDWAVLDEELREVTRGEEGDLWIGGANLFSGYWGEEERAKERLRSDPRPGRSGLLYNTGDRVREGDDGALHFAGRRDHMVKVRGYRVELGEVESAIYSCPEVAEAAVVPVMTASGSHTLVAFVCWKMPGGEGRAQLILRLKETVPLYMVPDRFLFPEALPRTTNGKVDRMALAAEAGSLIRQTG